MSNILDTFFILFKSNAAEAKKANEEVEKSAKKTEEALNKSKEASVELGASFVKLVEGAASVVAGIASINAVLARATINSALQLQGKILSQNTQDILAYGAAVQSAGGSVQGFQQYLQGATQTAANAGLKLPPIATFFRNIRRELEGLSSNEKLRRLGLLGISDPGMISLMTMTNDEFERSIALAHQHAQITQEEADVAREFSKQWLTLGQSFDTVQTKLASAGLPTFTAVVKEVQKLSQWVATDGEAVNGFFAALTAIMVGLAAATAIAFAPIIAAGVGLGLIGKGIYDVGRGFGLFKGGAGSSPGGIGLSGGAKASMDFWMSQGFTEAQAAGIVANEQRESGGDPGAVGDGGRARGIFQWHPDRRAGILAGTGIDVANASHGDQLKAAMWEMQQRGDDARVRSARSPEEAAAIFSQHFERPAGGMAEAELRARMAREGYNSWTMGALAEGKNQMVLASSSSLAAGGSVTNQGGARSVSLSTGPITVVTQATDAQGIAAGIDGALKSRYRDAAANLDDGIQN